MTWVWTTSERNLPSEPRKTPPSGERNETVPTSPDGHQKLSGFQRESLSFETPKRNIFDRSSPSAFKSSGLVSSSPRVVEKPEPERLPPRLSARPKPKPTHPRLRQIVLAPCAVGPSRNHTIRKNMEPPFDPCFSHCCVQDKPSSTKGPERQRVQHHSKRNNQVQVPLRHASCQTALRCSFRETSSDRKGGDRGASIMPVQPVKTTTIPSASNGNDASGSTSAGQAERERQPE